MAYSLQPERLRELVVELCQTHRKQRLTTLLGLELLHGKKDTNFSQRLAYEANKLLDSRQDLDKEMREYLTQKGIYLSPPINEDLEELIDVCKLVNWFVPISIDKQAKFKQNRKCKFDGSLTDKQITGIIERAYNKAHDNAINFCPYPVW